MIKYEVGKMFPHPNIQPGAENCRAQIAGSSFDVYYFIAGAKSADKNNFKNSLIRLHVYVEDHVPFIAVSYLGSTWTYDFTINVVGDRPEVQQKFFEQGNAVTLFLIDARTNVLLAGRFIGLYPETEAMIKDACKKQTEVYSDRMEVDRVIQRVYATNSTDDLIRKSQSWEI